jgi:hypothetical protein
VYGACFFTSSGLIFFPDSNSLAVSNRGGDFGVPGDNAKDCRLTAEDAGTDMGFPDCAAVPKILPSLCTRRVRLVSSWGFTDGDTGTLFDFWAANFFSFFLPVCS